jgi:hypothetical protein
MKTYEEKQEIERTSKLANIISYWQLWNIFNRIKQ